MQKYLRFLAPALIALGLLIPLAYAADTTTPNLLLTNQEAGGNLNTWGDIADANFEQLDNKLGDTTSLSTTGGTTTLTSTQEIVQIVKVTGTLVSNATLTFSCRGGYWVISNETSGAFSVTANCAGQTGTIITQGTKLGVYSNGTDIKAVGATGTKVVGEVFDFAGTACPSQSLEPFGQSVLRTSYASLFTAIGVIYGSVDGTHFTLPDLRGRVVAGEDDMGGSSANRLTAANAQGVNGDTLGATGGEEAHTQLLAEIAAHTHTQQGSFGSGTVSADHSHSGSTSSDGNHNHSYTAPSDTGNTASAGTPRQVYNGNGSNTGSNGNHNHTFTTGGISANHTHTTTISGATTSSGSGTAFNNLQPTIILHKCIYTGV